MTKTKIHSIEKLTIDRHYCGGYLHPLTKQLAAGLIINGDFFNEDHEEINKESVIRYCLFNAQGRCNFPDCSEGCCPFSNVLSYTELANIVRGQHRQE